MSNRDQAALVDLRAHLRACVEDLYVLIQSGVANRDEVMSVVAETAARAAQHEGVPQ